MTPEEQEEALRFYWAMIRTIYTDFKMKYDMDLKEILKRVN